MDWTTAGVGCDDVQTVVVAPVAAVASLQDSSSSDTCALGRLVELVGDFAGDFAAASCPVQGSQLVGLDCRDAYV